jgi:hypothetical protein
MPYKCHFFSLIDTGTAFKKTTCITLDELVSLHLYLDVLIVCDKGLMISLDFQVISPFPIAFVLDTNAYISKYLQEQFFPYNTDIPHLKYCEEPM